MDQPDRAAPTGRAGPSAPRAVPTAGYPHRRSSPAERGIGSRLAGFEARGGRGHTLVISVARLALAAIAARQATTGAGQLAAAGQASAEPAGWQLAGAVGLLTVAARPGSAEALLPLFAVVGTLTAAVSVRDIAAGTTTASRQSTHLWFEIGLAMTIVVWTLLQGQPAAQRLDRAHFAPPAGQRETRDG